MSMKLIGNRNNPNCIHQMQWNNKMDLIALAHETGNELILIKSFLISNLTNFKAK